MKSEHYQGCWYYGKEMYEPSNWKACDLVVVGGYPGVMDCRPGAQSSNYLAPLKNAAIRHGEGMSVGYQFSIACSPWGRRKNQFRKPKAEELDRCRPMLMEYLEEAQPGVVLLAGAEACRSFGIKRPIKKIRGTICEVEVGGRVVNAVVTYGLHSFDENPGLYPVIIKDFMKALTLCRESMEVPDLVLETPVAYEDVISALDRTQEHIDERCVSTGQQFLISVDTETTSLTPYKSDDRVIAVSLSAGQDWGLSFLLDLRDASYTDTQREVVLEKFVKLLDPTKVVTCTANAGFDYQWLALRYGLEIEFFDFDVLLAEHVLEEDKKGNYNLKTLTRDYCPELGGYEDVQRAALDGVNKAIKDEHKQLETRVIEELWDWWESLRDQERENILWGWVEKGFLSADKVDMLSKVKTVKKAGKFIVSPTYKKSVIATLRKIPEKELGVEMPEPRKATFEDVPAMTMLKYAAMDAVVTRKIFVAQYHRLQEEMKGIRAAGIERADSLLVGFRGRTMPLSVKLAEMEYKGVRFDREKARSYIEQLGESIDEYKEQMFSEAGREFNTSASSGDLVQILHSEKRFTPLKKTAKGVPSTDKEAIGKLQTKYNSPFLDILLVHRELESDQRKLEKLLGKSGYDGKLHPSFNQNGTATHRLSSSEPNLQNIKHYIEAAGLNIKALFLPDSEEYELFDLDISNAEMRVLAAYAQDDRLIDAFQNGKDIHSVAGAALSDFSYEDIVASKEDKQSEQYKIRQVGKKINFATVYGQKAKSLSKDLGATLGRSVDENEAQKYLDDFFEEYPGIRKYVDSTEAFVRKYGFAYTQLGRRRCFPMVSHCRTQLFSSYRQAVNFRIQSTAADIINVNLVDLADRIEPLGGRIILTVHDSILFQLPKGTDGVIDILDEVFLEQTREWFPWLPVEWKYDVGKGPTYGECVERV